LSLAIKLALAPLLVAQGLATRRMALRLPEADGPRAGVQGHGAPVSLLILGDSSAAGVGVPTQRQALAGHLPQALAQQAGRQVHWTLVARSGLNSLQAMSLWHEQGAPRADLAVVVTGVNDVVDQIAPARVRRARESLALALEREAGARHIVFAALPPMRAFTALPQPLRWVAGLDADRHDRALADWLRGQTARTRLAVDLPLDPALLAEDGFHPGPQVYRLWGQALADHLAAQLRARAPGQ
jgi:lysophospholipase L1-like esterase